MNPHETGFGQYPSLRDELRAIESKPIGYEDIDKLARTASVMSTAISMRTVARKMSDQGSDIFASALLRAAELLEQHAAMLDALRECIATVQHARVHHYSGEQLTEALFKAERVCREALPRGTP